MRHCICSLFVLVFSVFVSPWPVYAEFGLDAINQEMKNNGLFSPHANNCSASEAFVAIGAGGTSGGTGFCIETAERSGSGLTWDDARQVCAGLGKRLPELVEFKIACKSAGGLGLNNMTDDDEWVTNFPWYTFTESYRFMLAPVAGSGGCAYSTVARVSAETSPLENTGYAYRCVH